MTTIKRFAFYGCVAIVLTLVAIYVGLWASNVHGQRKIQSKLAAIKSVKLTSPRESLLRGTGVRYALEIRSLGVAVGDYYQDSIWNRIERMRQIDASVIPSDLAHALQSADTQAFNLRLANEATFEYVGKAVVSDWPVPSFAAEPSLHRDDIDSAGAAISSRARDTGLAYTYFLWEDDINSDDASPLIDRLFAFFDANPEVPEAVIIARDADRLRCRFAQRENRCPDVARRPEVLTSLVTLLVSRTDRVDRYIRPFARYEETQATNAKQTQRDYIKQYRFYNMVDQEFNTLHRNGGIRAVATLKSDYWRAQLPRFLETVGDTGDTRTFQSPYLPLRWMTWQLKTFDKAPLLSYMHRPVTIRLRDRDGVALKGEAKIKALRSGWQTALTSLPDGRTPDRVFHDRTNDGGLRSDLSLVLLDQTTPIDLNNVDQGYDIGVRIGNTGISSPFLQIALGTMAGYKTGKTAAAIHRRADGDVTITMVSPPDEETKAAWMGESKRNPFNIHVPQG